MDKDNNPQRDKYNNHKKWVMFPGRWQPLHKGHMYLIDQALGQDKNVWIGVRDTEISDKNPYTIKQRMEMIKRAYSDVFGDKLKATVIPDIEEIRYGRGVGYGVTEVSVPKDIEEISATRIRAGEDRSIKQEVDNYLTLLQSTLWFTGLPCSGKTTIADRLKEEIDNMDLGYTTRRLDGDDVREGLNYDCGFTHEGRKENLRRISHVAKYENDNGGLVLASFVSPTNDLRGVVKDILGDNMKTVYVDAPLEVCEERDVKGMYAKARAGEMPNFTGIDAPFEAPKNPDLVVNTAENNLETCVHKIIDGFGF